MGSEENAREFGTPIATSFRKSTKVRHKTPRYTIICQPRLTHFTQMFTHHPSQPKHKFGWGWTAHPPNSSSACHKPCAAAPHRSPSLSQAPGSTRGSPATQPGSAAPSSPASARACPSVSPGARAVLPVGNWVHTGTESLLLTSPNRPTEPKIEPPQSLLGTAKTSQEMAGWWER